MSLATYIINDKKEQEMSYTFDEHRYNFAVWTAARAIQRGLSNASSANISQLFKQLKIVNRIKPDNIKNANDFDTFHKEFCKNLINEAKKLEIDLEYGRAAKLLAVFIKSYYILPEKGKGQFSKYAHPPIDRIMQEKAKKEKKLKTIQSWTKLNEKQYFELLNKLRVDENKGLWYLERFWNPE